MGRPMWPMSLEAFRRCAARSRGVSGGGREGGGASGGPCACNFQVQLVSASARRLATARCGPMWAGAGGGAGGQQAGPMQACGRGRVAAVQRAGWAPAGRCRAVRGRPAGDAAGARRGGPGRWSVIPARARARPRGTLHELLRRERVVTRESRSRDDPGQRREAVQCGTPRARVATALIAWSFLEQPEITWRSAGGGIGVAPRCQTFLVSHEHS